MSSRTSRIRSVLGVITVLPIFACGGDPVSPDRSLEGMFYLSAIADSALPFTLAQTPSGRQDAWASRIVFSADGSFVSSMEIHDWASGVLTESIDSTSGTYVANGATLVLTVLGDADSPYQGAIEGDTLVTVTRGGRAYRYGTTIVDDVIIIPAAGLMDPGDMKQYAVVAFDARDSVVVGRPARWSVPVPGVVTITPGGLVTAVSSGYGQVTATVDGFSTTVGLTVTTP